MNRTIEQRLVDLMFEIGLKSYEWHKNNPNVTREQITDWVRGALNGAVFTAARHVSGPIGSSWGVIQDYIPEEQRGIHIESANRPD